MKWFVIIFFSINSLVFLGHTVFSTSDVAVESLVPEGQVPGLKLLNQASSLTLLSTQLPQDQYPVVQKHGIDLPQVEEHQTIVEEKHQQSVDDFSLSVVNAVSLAVSSAVAEETQRSTTTDSQCFEVGPFEQEKVAIIIQDRLFEFRLGSRTEQRAKKTLAGFWIYLPALASVSLARLKLEELKMHGLTDVARIQMGQLKNTISLGVYHQQDRALERAERIRGLGFSPQIQEHDQLHEEIWVVLKTDIHHSLTEPQWQQVLADYEKVSVKEMPCRLNTAIL